MPKRVREKSSSEESYASPVTQLPQHGLPSPPISSDGRSRRTRGSSSDEDQTVWDMINEDYRAGGPHLAALPCRTVPLDMNNNAARLWNSDPSFARSIINVLRRHAIEAEAVELWGRQSEDVDDPDNERVMHTVVVSAKKTRFDKAWITACFDIRNIFRQRQLMDLNVEIVDSRASVEKFATPVAPSHPIYPLWDNISSHIVRDIGKKGWLSLECFRWGESYGPSWADTVENPVTVILTVPRDSEEDWKPTREHIVSILTAFKLNDVAVSILRGKVWRGSGFSKVVLPDNAWEKEAQFGMSIGPSNSDLSASTLGAIIEVKSPAGEWMRFGLTCFHAVVADKEQKDMTSVEKKCRKNWDRNGIAPNDKNAGNLKMDQPALKDHKHRMDLVNRDIEEMPNSEFMRKVRSDIENDEFVVPSDMKAYEKSEKDRCKLMELRDRIEGFFPGKAYLGHVFAASGLRRTDENTPSQLDWALIKIRDVRMGPNKVPPKGEYEGSGYEFNGQPLSVPYGGEIADGAQLFKFGRTTSFTAGKFTGLRSVLLPSGEVDDKGNPIEHETWEHTVTGFNGRSFSSLGDSGAVVFNAGTRFVGLLFGGNDKTGATYFTPWPRLLADIKKITNATDVRIPDN